MPAGCPDCSSGPVRVRKVLSLLQRFEVLWIPELRRHKRQIESLTRDLEKVMGKLQDMEMERAMDVATKPRD